MVEALEHTYTHVHAHKCIHTPPLFPPQQDPFTRRILALASGVGVELVDAFAAGNDSACTLVLEVAQ